MHSHRSWVRSFDWNAGDSDQSVKFPFNSFGALSASLAELVSAQRDHFLIPAREAIALTARNLTPDAAAGSAVHAQLSIADSASIASNGSAVADSAVASAAITTAAAPVLSISGGGSQSEGTTVTPAKTPMQYTFTVTLDSAASTTVTVHYAVTGTATATSSAKAAATDFVGGVLPSGNITFAPGETSQTVTISVKSDATIEGDEGFKVTLSAPTGGATIGTKSATAAIVNDDFPAGILGVHILNTSVYGAAYPKSDPNHYGSTDPTDIVYDAGAHCFYLCDSEIDESPMFASNNLWKLDGSGNLLEAISLMPGPNNPNGFTTEPTGLALWTDGNGVQHMFVNDDDFDLIYDTQVTQDANGKTVITVLNSFSAGSFGAADPEDLSIDPNTGHLFVLSEKNFTIYEISQDGSTVFDTIQLPDTFRKPGSGAPSLEGLAYDAAHDFFYVCGGFSPNIFVYSREGALLQTINLLKFYPNTNGAHVYPKGLELAPSSDGIHMSLWVTDYGLDQVPDGRLIEIVLNELAPTSSASTLAAASTQAGASAQTTIMQNIPSHVQPTAVDVVQPFSFHDFGEAHQLHFTHHMDLLL